MNSIEKIIEVIFGGQITADQVITILVAIFAVVKSITEWRVKVKLIKADKELSSADEKFEAQQKELDSLKQCIALQSDIIATAYLSSTTLDDKTKKAIALYSSKIEKISKVDLSETTNKIIDKVTQYIPNNAFGKKKEDIIMETKAAEQIIDSVNDSANKLIDNLPL